MQPLITGNGAFAADPELRRGLDGYSQSPIKGDRFCKSRSHNLVVDSRILRDGKVEIVFVVSLGLTRALPRFVCLSVGAYEPRWFRSGRHMVPEESIEAFMLLGAEHFVAMHWGAYNWSDEAIDAGPVLLKQLSCDETAATRDRLHVPQPGGVIDYERGTPPQVSAAFHFSTFGRWPIPAKTGSPNAREINRKRSLVLPVYVHVFNDHLFSRALLAPSQTAKCETQKVSVKTEDMHTVTVSRVLVKPENSFSFKESL